ncbi:MAG: dipeptide epimerase [Calditrichae bacterium]|nr:dipeptide epimerase [Calditrichia bacterium]
MKITHLECWAQDLTINEPYTIAYETVSHCTNVFLRAETDSGISGWGCAAPDAVITGETGGSVVQAYNDFIFPLLKDFDPFRYASAAEQIKKQLVKQPSACAMADMLLYDLMARKAGEPLYKFLGGFRDFIPTSITIGILPVEETLKKAKQFIKSGFSILKIKGGCNVEDDIRKLNLVRQKMGPQIEIRFDANQGYNLEQAIEFIRETKDAEIELLEQPTDKMNEELLGQVTKNVDIPVMADESLMNLKDVFRLTANNFTDMINIKLMKAGGITEAMHINSVAKAAGVESMIGCMDESALAISAGLHFALSRPNISYADLDGHLDLQDDPFAGTVILKEGVLYPVDANGFSGKIRKKWF